MKLLYKKLNVSYVEVRGVRNPSLVSVDTNY